MMSKQKGFTLIELVMVIVILGILAATALPKFVSLQKDAKVASLKGMKAALQTSVQIANAKALINGTNPASGGIWLDMNNNGTTTTADGDIVVRYMHPEASTRGFANIIELDGFTQVNGEFRLNAINGCEVAYAAPSAQGGSPTYTITDTSC